MVSGVFGMFFIHRNRTASLPLICSLLRIQKKKNCTSEGSYSYAEEEHIP